MHQILFFQIRFNIQRTLQSALVLHRTYITSEYLKRIGLVDKMKPPYHGDLYDDLKVSNAVKKANKNKTTNTTEDIITN